MLFYYIDSELSTHSLYYHNRKKDLFYFILKIYLFFCVSVVTALNILHLYTLMVINPFQKTLILQCQLLKQRSKKKTLSSSLFVYLFQQLSTRFTLFRVLFIVFYGQINSKTVTNVNNNYNNDNNKQNHHRFHHSITMWP